MSTSSAGAIYLLLICMDNYPLGGLPLEEVMSSDSCPETEGPCVGSCSSCREASGVDCSSPLTLFCGFMGGILGTLWHVLILTFGWALVCPADTAPVVVSQGGVVHGMPGGMWTVHAVTVLFPIGARLVTQVHGFFHAALTPLLPKAVYPLHDLSGVMQNDVFQFLCGGLLCQ